MTADDVTLTEAERDAFCVCRDGVGPIIAPGDAHTWQCSELWRRVADRLAAVQAEWHIVHVTVEPVAEDVVRCDNCEEWVTSGAPERREHSPGETCVEADERAAENWARAESAEAERDDARRRLAEVEALADEWERRAGRGIGSLSDAVVDLRAAAANPPAEVDEERGCRECGPGCLGHDADLVQHDAEVGARALREAQRRLYDGEKTAGSDPDDENTFAEEIAHLHEEVSEAFRAFRLTKDCTLTIDVDGKPQGVPAECADVAIGLFYIAERFGFDLMDAVEVKHAYNLTRSYAAEGRRLHARADALTTEGGQA